MLSKAFVITHPKSIRYESILRHLGELDLDFEVSPAVFPEGESPWSEHNDVKTRMRRLGYPMSRGEVGCFLAHRLVWQSIVRQPPGVFLVLEDDAFVQPNRISAIKSAAEILAGRAMIARLVSDPRPPFRRWKELREGVSLVRPTRPGNLTVSYILTSEAAETLLRHSVRFDGAVDDFFNLEWKHGNTVMHFEPEIAEHRDAGNSTIGVRNKPPTKFRVRVWREFIRAWRSVVQKLDRERTLWRMGLRLQRVEKPPPEIRCAASRSGMPDFQDRQKK